MRIFLFLMFFTSSLFLVAQDELLDQVSASLDEGTIYANATFKGTRLINGQSVETRDKGSLVFIISHRFSNIDGGAYEFFGLDGAQIRLGLDYAITDDLYIGLARNSLGKTIDGFVKYRILRQSKGDRVMPVSLTYFGSTAYQTLKTTPERSFSEKLAFTNQVLIARKITPDFSFQLMPSWVHYNLVAATDNNDVYALGFGGRYKLGNRFSLNAEYFLQLQEKNSTYNNAFAIGFDIDTGGHVFQLHFTNAAAMIDKGFIGETTDEFFSGDIRFGFNITRNFQLK